MKAKIKAIVSTILIICFTICAVTGLTMFFIKGGMIGVLPRKYVTDIHSWSSFVLIGGVIIHFLLNLSLYRGELVHFTGKNKVCRQKSEKEGKKEET